MRISDWSSDVCSSDLPAGPGGRLVTRFDDGTEWEIGAVRHWLPGERLAFAWRLPSFREDQATEVDIRFEAVGGETRVTVEHRGWETIPQKHVARPGLETMLFKRRLGAVWRGEGKGMGGRGWEGGVWGGGGGWCSGVGIV